jgi:hypothetical protein
MPQTPRKKSLYDSYRFPGFTPVRELKGRFGDRWARVIRLNRRSKKLCAGRAAPFIAAGTTRSRAKSATSPRATTGSILSWIFAGSNVGNARL